MERRPTQIKQLRKGLKDSGVPNMIKERPAPAAVLFPTSAQPAVDSQAAHLNMLTASISTSRAFIGIVLLKVE